MKKKNTEKLTTQGTQEEEKHRETGNIGSRETGYIGSGETGNIGSSVTGNIGSRETGKIRSRETGNIGYTRRKNTTGGKDEPDIIFMRKSQRYKTPAVLLIYTVKSG